MNINLGSRIIIFKYLVNNKKRKVMKKIILLMSLFVMASCCCNKNVELEGTTWKLVEMNGESNVAAFEAEADALTFMLNPADMAIGGRTDCNRFFGQYELSEGNVIDIKSMGMTRMACPNMTYEQPFVGMLDAADSYEIDGETLNLFQGDKKIGQFKAIIATEVE